MLGHIGSESKAGEDDKDREKNLHVEFEELYSSLLHEINTPLSIIFGCARVGSKRAAKNDEAGRLLQLFSKIEESAKRISSILDGLRGLYEKSSRVAQEEHVVDIVNQSLVMLEQKLQKTGVRLELMNINSDLVVECVSIEISQVIHNLVSNAIDAASATDEKWVSLQVVDRDDAVQVIVVDSGNGVPDSVRQKIYKPFFTTKKDRGGTGLGLSICRKIVALHQGSLRVDPDNPNTKFVITLPKKNFAARGLKVLIVDDEPILRSLVAKEFIGRGCEVAEAADGLSAMEKVGKSRFDIVLTDIRMPNGGGVDLMKQINSAIRYIPSVYVMTGFSDTEAKELRNLGTRKIFKKPFIPEDLVADVLLDYRHDTSDIRLVADVG